jgi:hypothetical protein
MMKEWLPFSTAYDPTEDPPLSRRGDPKELEFSREQQAALAESLDAYGNGDLNAALEKYLPTDSLPPKAKGFIALLLLLP